MIGLEKMLIWNIIETLQIPLTNGYIVEKLYDTVFNNRFIHLYAINWKTYLKYFYM